MNLCAVSPCSQAQPCAFSACEHIGKGTGNLKLLKGNNSSAQVIWLPASSKTVCSATAATEEHSTSLSCMPGLKGQHVFISGPLVQTGGELQVARC